MNNHSLLGKCALLAIVGCLLLAIAGPSFLGAQSSASEYWEKAAGGKMSFEVASVKRANDPQQLGYHLWSGQDDETRV